MASKKIKRGRALNGIIYYQVELSDGVVQWLRLNEIMAA